jgi:hypothetical protein
LGSVFLLGGFSAVFYFTFASSFLGKTNFKVLFRRAENVRERQWKTFFWVGQVVVLSMWNTMFLQDVLEMEMASNLVFYSLYVPSTLLAFFLYFRRNK